MITRRMMLAAGSASLGVVQPMPAKAQRQTGAIRIGVLEDMSGVFSELGGQGTVVAARMAVEDFGGTVLDRPIEVLGGDHHNKPDIGGAIARKWFDADNVGLITGLTNSAVALAIHTLAAEKDRIDIVVNATNDALIEENCSPNGIMWNYTARAVVTSTVTQALKSVGKSWFFVASDFVGGHIMENEASPLLRAAGGRSVGSIYPPLGTTDFSSELLAAQSSGAEVLAVVTYGQDFLNIMKQAAEFGILRTMRPVVPFVYQSDLHAVGPAVIQGMTVAAPFYWDLNPETRAWSARFRALTGRAPDMGHGGAYAAVSHYLKSVRLAGTDKAGPVLQAMRSLPIDDMYTSGASIRRDGMVVRPMHLFEGKAPAESRDPWDLLRHTGTVDKDAAFALPPGNKCHLLET